MGGSLRRLKVAGKWRPIYKKGPLTRSLPMKTISTLMLAAAFLFARPAFAGADEAPKAETKTEKKADKKKDDKKEEKKDEKKAEKGGW
jgi:ribosomal protein L12E/L44/L45/RPP1/RPP2